MAKAKPLPDGIQFSFENIEHPDLIEMQFDMHVFLGDEAIYDEPVLYLVVIAFGTHSKRSVYRFRSVELHEQHDISPYNDRELGKLLTARLEKLFETCCFTNKQPLHKQLKNFLSEYGDNKQLKFFL